MYMTRIGAQCPELPCDIIFEEFEWKAIYSVTQRAKPPKNPPSINEMIKIIAGVGGHLGRKNDPPPGYKALWIGHQRCREFVFAVEAMAKFVDLPF